MTPREKARTAGAGGTPALPVRSPFLRQGSQEWLRHCYWSFGYTALKAMMSLVMAVGYAPAAISVPAE